MRSLETLIALARQRVKEVDYSATSGIPQEVFIELANEAQDHLQMAIANVYSNEFITESEISLASNDEDYTVPDRVLGNSRIVGVEYSPTGLAQDYYPIQRGTIKDRSSAPGVPSFYIYRDNEVLLNFIPNATQGKIRVSYYRELDDLDIKRATVNGTPSGAVIATSSADITSSPVNFATPPLYVCISDKFGNVMLRNGVVSSWSSPNLTLAANVSTYLVGNYSLANLANGHITFDRYTTTTSKLPDICERYLRIYMQKRILTINAANTSVEEDMELKTIENEILNSYADESRDVEEIMVLDPDIMW